MEDGATLRTHLQRLAYSSGKVDARLEAPPPARAVRGLWDAFLMLSASRRSGMSPHPLTMVDIEAYCRMANIQLSNWELETLIALDAVAMAAAAKNRKS
ncbi:MAG: phage tail assembly chaperone [Burkholderiaceae bacterium]